MASGILKQVGDRYSQKKEERMIERTARSEGQGKALEDLKESIKKDGDKVPQWKYTQAIDLSLKTGQLDDIVKEGGFVDKLVKTVRASSKKVFNEAVFKALVDNAEAVGKAIIDSDVSRYTRMEDTARAVSMLFNRAEKYLDSEYSAALTGSSDFKNSDRNVFFTDHQFKRYSNRMIKVGEKGFKFHRGYADVLRDYAQKVNENSHPKQDIVKIAEAARHNYGVAELFVESVLKTVGNKGGNTRTPEVAAYIAKQAYCRESRAKLEKNMLHAEKNALDSFESAAGHWRDAYEIYAKFE